MRELRKKIIFPLDFQDLKEALFWVERLSPYVGVFKIGLELFTKEGPRAVEEVKKRSEAQIFLDLKLLDIPNTIAGAVRSASSLGVDFLTVHILSGRRALESAVKSAEGGLKILGVTILTSLDKADLLELGFNGELISNLEDLVFKLAYLARATGCDGLVASAREVSMLKEAFPQLITVVPGIRLVASSKDDQQRTATPYEAIRKGADYLVIGRPIREAEDPENTLREILKDMQKGLEEIGCSEGR